MNNNKKIIGSVITLLLLIAAFIALNLPEKEESAPEPSTEIATAAPIYTVYDASADDIDSLVIKADGGEIKISRLKDKWTVNGRDPDDVNTAQTEEVIGYITPMTSKVIAAENAEPASDYGFDAPTAVIEITRADGAADTITVGGISPSLGEYFVKSSKDERVYTISQYKTEAFLRKESDYRTFSRFSIKPEEVEAIEFTRSDGENFTISRKPDEDTELYNSWQLEGKYSYTVNAIDDYIDESILEPLGTLDISRPAEEGASYGLDAPSCVMKITVIPQNDDGSRGDPYTEEITLGAKTADGDTYAAYKGGVYRVSTSALDFAYTKQFYIISKLALLSKADDVEKAELSFGGTHHVIEPVSGKNEADISFRYDGEDIDSEKGSELYQALIGLAVDGEYNGEPLGEYAGTVRFTFKNGEDTEAEFYEIDALKYALKRNGKIDFTVKRSAVEEMIKSFK